MLHQMIRVHYAAASDWIHLGRGQDQVTRRQRELAQHPRQDSVAVPHPSSVPRASKHTGHGSVIALLATTSLT
jgi:hypothetical protein